VIRLFCLALVLGLAAPALAADGEWGSLKGRIVWGEKEPPAKVALKVNKDEGVCLANGPILSEEYVVNPKNGGVRWVVVWIARDKGTGKAETTWAPLPIHPLLQEPKDKEVVMDQPPAASSRTCSPCARGRCSSSRTAPPSTTTPTSRAALSARTRTRS